MLSISVAQKIRQRREEGAHATQQVGQGALEDAMTFFRLQPCPRQEGSDLGVIGDDLEAFFVRFGGV